MLLQEHCPEVNVVDRCPSAKNGLISIEKFRPELVFLDIEMPYMNGFEMLEIIKEINFSVIFTTGYDQYAIRAIRFSALDYLLKPIDPKELISAISKFKERKHLASSEQFKMLMDHFYNRAGNFNKIAVPTLEGYELIPVAEILRCEADDNYTILFLTNKKKIIACRTLKEVEEQFNTFPTFLRVHHSHMVNLNEVIQYIRGEGGYLVMSNGETVNVSRSKKEVLLQKLLPPKSNGN
jgi:two-component system LytT family response regulator